MTLAVHINSMKQQEALLEKRMEGRQKALRQIKRCLPPVWQPRAIHELNRVIKPDSMLYPTKLVISKNYPTSGSITVYRSDNRKYRLWYEGSEMAFKYERLHLE